MWLIFGLAAPLLWALVHILDEYCVDHLFEKPWMGVVTSAAASAIAFIGLPFILFYVDFSTFSLQLFLAAIIAGLFIQVSQGFYFTALSYSEAGIVAGYWNMIPALLPVASFIIFGQILSLNQYIGIVILIIASTALCLIDR
jgi:drug/metabolite transporter (DMT)-like permease